MLQSTIFDSEELKDEYFNIKLDLNLAFGAFLLIKPHKKFFQQESLKKIFQKLHQSTLMVQKL